MTTFLCPHCEAKLQSPNPDIQGKRVRCVKCRSTFTVTAGLIVRDTPVSTATAEPELSTPSGPASARRSGKTKPRKSTSRPSSAMLWARNLIALALLIVIVTATIIILINKNWIPIGGD